MLTLRNASLAIAVVLAGCAQIEVGNADTGPGGTVTTYDANKQSVAGWIPQAGVVNVAPGIDHWTRIRVIAPEGATECRSGAGLFSRGGPQDKGRPDADRIVTLTSREGDRTAHFVCETPRGPVRRSVSASVYTMPIPPSAPPHIVKQLESTRRDTHVLPPLVHMDPKDPQAEARWAALGAEACPVILDRVSMETGFLCLPGMLEKFKAADLGEAS